MTTLDGEPCPDVCGLVTNLQMTRLDQMCLTYAAAEPLARTEQYQ